MVDQDSVWSDADDASHIASVGDVASVGSVHSIGSIASKGSVGSRLSEIGSTKSGSDQKISHTDRSDADVHFCTFRLGEQLFGLDVAAVGEVFTVEHLVAVPRTPSSVLGLTNLRGAALAVIDLCAVLGLETTARMQEASGAALVLNLGSIRVAAAIDVVESVFPARRSSIRESNAIDEHPAIAGFLGADDERVVSVLDVTELTERVRQLSLHYGNDDTDPGAAFEATQAGM